MPNGKDIKKFLNDYLCCCFDVDEEDFAAAAPLLGQPAPAAAAPAVQVMGMQPQPDPIAGGLGTAPLPPPPAPPDVQPSAAAITPPPKAPAPPPPKQGASQPGSAPKKWTVTGLQEKPRINPPKPGAFVRLTPVDPEENPSKFSRQTIHQLRTKIVVDGNDTDSLIKNLNSMLESPVHKDAAQRAAATTQCARGLVLDDTALDRLRATRMGGSETMKDSNTHAVQARENWRAADATVLKAARDPNFQTTAENLTQLLVTVNQQLEENVSNDAGELRVNETPAAGTIDVTHDDPNATQMYIPGIQVEAEIKRFATWLSDGLIRGDDPIVLAASSYQRIASIHPFHNANGRSGRMMMDFVLQRCGLPPALLGEDVNLGAFCRIAPDAQPSPTGATNIVRNGVEAAIRELAKPTTT